MKKHIKIAILLSLMPLVHASEDQQIKKDNESLVQGLIVNSSAGLSSEEALNLQKLEASIEAELNQALEKNEFNLAVEHLLKLSYEKQKKS